MHSSQCRNALLDRHDLDIIDLLSSHLPSIYEDSDDAQSLEERIDFLQNRDLPQFWGREQLNALQHDVEWWSAYRVHAAYDPFWYFELEVEGNVTLDHLRAQRVEVKQRGNKLDRERRDRQQFHFMNRSHDVGGYGYQSATYNVTKPIKVDGYNNTFKEHSKMNQVTYCRYYALYFD